MASNLTQTFDPRIHMNLFLNIQYLDLWLFDLTRATANNIQGYADSAQIGTGLRQRIYSRAFIVGDANNPNNRWVYLVLDTANGDTAIRNGVLEGVAALGSTYSMYGSSNIALTGTHSHSGPGACKSLCHKYCAQWFKPRSARPNCWIWNECSRY